MNGNGLMDELQAMDKAVQDLMTPFMNVTSFLTGAPFPGFQNNFPGR